MRRLIFISAVAAVALAGLPHATLASSTPGGNRAGELSSIYLTGTLDRRDRPRVYARFDRRLPAARGALRGARVRLGVRADVVVAGTGVSERVHTVLSRRLSSLHRRGSWQLELPLTAAQASRIERAANVPNQVRVDGTAIQGIVPAAGDPLPPSQISGVAATSGVQFEGQEKVNGSVSAFYVVEKPECEHRGGGCPSVPTGGHWAHPSWAGNDEGKDNVHGDLAMTVCNGEYTEQCGGSSGGLFAAIEVDAISPYPEGTAYFEVSEGPNGIAPQTEIGAYYNEHETSSPPTGCSIAASAYFPKYVDGGPKPTCFSSQTEVVGNEGEEESEGDDGEGTAYDSYVVTTVWPAGSNPGG